MALEPERTRWVTFRASPGEVDLLESAVEASEEVRSRSQLCRVAAARLATELLAGIEDAEVGDD